MMGSRRVPSKTSSIVAAISVAGLYVALIPPAPAQGAASLPPLQPSAQVSVSPAPLLRAEVIAEGLEHPWAVAFLPGGRFLVTERVGRMRVIEADGRMRAPIAGLPSIDVGGQGGLLDVITSRDFERSRRILFCFTEPGQGGNSTALASATLSADAARLDGVRIIFSQRPKFPGRHHFGCRIVELPDGTIALTLGERFNRMEDAQRLDNHLGKIVRIKPDGTVPSDNPFVGRGDTLPEIFSFGHRNPQGATIGPDGRLWMHEHGPQGGDEINRIEPGRNYGWPVITHGERYGGGRIGEGLTAKPGLEQPLHHWTPSIAPSGMAFLTSNRYGERWRGSLFVGSVKFSFLTRLVFEGDRVTHEERLLGELGQWVRDVRQGPDGLLYLINDSRNGRLIRLVPSGAQ